MAEATDVFLAKAEACLASAETELANGRYDNVANRCYYSCFPAAVAALEAAGLRPTGSANARWSHAVVQSLFVGVLINRRKRYPGNLRDVLTVAFALRQTGDYTRDRVSEREARLVLRRSREFVEAIRSS